MLDSTTKNLVFVRPIPQGSASPAPGSVWTDEYGWIVPVKPPTPDAFPIWGHPDGGLTPWDYNEPEVFT